MTWYRQLIGAVPIGWVKEPTARRSDAVRTPQWPGCLAAVNGTSAPQNHPVRLGINGSRDARQRGLTAHQMAPMAS
jgi:hypothetical protein